MSKPALLLCSLMLVSAVSHADYVFRATSDVVGDVGPAPVIMTAEEAYQALIAAGCTFYPSSAANMEDTFTFFTTKQITCGDGSDMASIPAGNPGFSTIGQLNIWGGSNTQLKFFSGASVGIVDMAMTTFGANASAVAAGLAGLTVTQQLSLSSLPDFTSMSAVASAVTPSTDVGLTDLPAVTDVSPLASVERFSFPVAPLFADMPNITNLPSAFGLAVRIKSIYLSGNVTSDVSFLDRVVGATGGDNEIYVTVDLDAPAFSTKASSISFICTANPDIYFQDTFWDNAAAARARVCD